jgi:FAD/FMN-containing dehydrogenase
MMQPATSWGRLSHELHEVRQLEAGDKLAATLQAATGNGIAQGNGRSYGDVCLNPGGTLWRTRGLDHLIGWNEATGRLVCEAGVLLEDIQSVMVPRGWMLPVTPGTQLITVGGAIANDVHGKNHHALGSFGDHVCRIWLMRTDGESIECGPDLKPDWFAATVGGMGLTGVIARAELQLRKVAGPWLETETLPFHGLDRFFELSDGSEQAWEHTVSWIDCLSGSSIRGAFMRGNHVTDPGAVQGLKEPEGKPRSMPVTPPVSLVNRLSLKPFNLAYYQLQRSKAGRAIAHYRPFFYPLDNLHHWNRMYGPAGFYQYQSVVPRSVGLEATRAMLDTIASSGEGSFLAVLKTFGNRPAPGMLSFPRPGVTLALDFPNRGAKTLALFERLDAIVWEAGGALYSAKDARMSRDMFETGYPGAQAFQAFRDPGISSAMSRRIMGQ